MSAIMNTVVRRLVMKQLYIANGVASDYTGKTVLCGPKGSGRWYKANEYVSGREVLKLELPPFSLEDHVSGLKHNNPRGLGLEFITKCMPDNSVLMVRNVDLVSDQVLEEWFSSRMNIVATSGFGAMQRLTDMGFKCEKMKRWSYYDFMFMTRGNVIGDLGPYKRASEIAGTPGFYVDAVNNPDPNYSNMLRKAVQVSKEWEGDSV